METESIESKGKRLKTTHKYKCYGKTKTKYVQLLYIFASILWLFLIFYLQLYDTDQISALIIMIPLFTFGLGYFSASELTVEVEDDMFKTNMLSIGLLLVLPLLTWMNRDYTGDRRKFVSVLVAAIVFTMLALIDVWVRKRWVSLVKHMKSIFQTASLTLLILGIYLYYNNRSAGLLP